MNRYLDVHFLRLNSLYLRVDFFHWGGENVVVEMRGGGGGGGGGRHFVSFQIRRFLFVVADFSSLNGPSSLYGETRSFRSR